MSYCGTCGNFFTPDCGHAKNGGICTPAMNPHEAAIANFHAATVSAYAEIEAMKADGRYTEQSFLDVKNKLDEERKAFNALLP